MDSEMMEHLLTTLEGWEVDLADSFERLSIQMDEISNIMND